MNHRLLLAAGVIASAVIAAASTPVVADVLNDIAQRGTIRIGYRGDAPPFSYKTMDGEPTGLAVALCQQAARSIQRQLDLPRLDIEYVEVNARSRFPALLEDRTDLHCGPASTTLSRRKTLDFSLLYFVDGADVVTRPGEYESIFDIEDGRVGVLGGTTTERLVRDLIQRNGLHARINTFQTHSDGLTALGSGDVDAYFGDSAILRFQIRNLGFDHRAELMGETFSFEPYALVMKRGETRLRLAVDLALSEIYDNGLIYNLILNELGDYKISPQVEAVYRIVGLPE
jgi:polar amino acid transport system substrate-binding protein/glutamate/aspartate transport system substrate-binding protein